MEKKYDESLNLPKTNFSMRGNLPKREPELFKEFEKENLYANIISKNKLKKLYFLHDGPPYANGDIHLGTALNKILKDFIVKYKNMCGFKAIFIPGWDTHGLPIELRALKSAKKDRKNLTTLEIRKMCKDYATKYVELQKKQFKSLGILADFENSYLTFKKEFEAKQVEIFFDMLQNGYIYKGLKPVYYCSECSTALAESEIEYEDDECYSLYVSFKVEYDNGLFKRIGIEKEEIYFVIWTTTPWTLPANVAVCLSSKFRYAIVKIFENYFIIAEDLLEKSLNDANIKNFEIVKIVEGKEFENIKVKHPLFNKSSIVILGEHVTLDSGTGCVHTAPGHGIEDFEVCNKYKDIPVKVVVDETGRLNKEAGEFCGLSLKKANEVILEKLKELNTIFAVKKITHKYPHCWRCGKAVIFRATKQWFCSIEKFKQMALSKVEDVVFIPSWGRQRIKNMIENRSDWCISRQRVWGVPIPIFYCSNCKKYIVNKVVMKNVVQKFKEYGSDCWYEKDVFEFIPKDFECPNCKGKVFKKEKDIMDVWFDSGCSHSGILEYNKDLKFPADLYLEGADQYRGWFQSSLLTCVAYKKKAPYKKVCTHGWVVDGEGRKMSKSLANGVAPEKILKTYGADILRLWVASSDYHNDIRISEGILKQLTESYRKIRNTARFMLGNIFDFNPNLDCIKYENLLEIDVWALYELNKLIKEVKSSYEDLKFYNIYHNIYNFCVVNMSNFYLDIIKDRLYCEDKFGIKRRAAQTTLYLILNSLTKMLAPILTFTSEEIWSSMPHKKDDILESVFYNEMCDEIDEINFKISKEFEEKWNNIVTIGNAVKKALEEKRKERLIGSSLEAKIYIYCNENLYDFIYFNKNLLEEVFIISSLEVLKNGEGEYNFKNLNISVDIEKADVQKCERCWKYEETVGKNSKHKTLCERCCKVFESI